MQINNNKLLDTVKIERLELDCIIGINPWERLTKQQITVDIEIDTASLDQHEVAEVIVDKILLKQ